MKNQLRNFLTSIKETVLYFGWFSLVVLFVLFVVNFSFISSMNSHREAIIFKETSAAERDMSTIDFHI